MSPTETDLGGPTVCPRCGATYGAEERFCPEDGMPLTRAGEAGEPADAAHETARKIRPQYARGDLVKVAMGQNQAETELIQGMLLEEGIPSVTRRTQGFDVPDFLAAGPRDIMVAEGGLDAARDQLREAEVRADEDSEYRPASASWPFRVLAGLLVLTLVVTAFFAAGLL